VKSRTVGALNQPKPFFTVPFQRDTMFVGREDIITAITEAHKQANMQHHKRAALVGLGGVG